MRSRRVETRRCYNAALLTGMHVVYCLLSGSSVAWVYCLNLDLHDQRIAMIVVEVRESGDSRP